MIFTKKKKFKHLKKKIQNNFCIIAFPRHEHHRADPGACDGRLLPLLARDRAGDAEGRGGGGAGAALCGGGHVEEAAASGGVWRRQPYVEEAMWRKLPLVEVCGIVQQYCIVTCHALYSSYGGGLRKGQHGEGAPYLRCYRALYRFFTL